MQKKQGQATTIVIAQSKGGAGKTTLAAHLGVAWALTGRTVVLIDTDTQGSLTRWYQQREKRQAGGAALSLIATTGWRAPAEIITLARDADILLIDTPPRADAEVRNIIKRADLVLVPVQPSPVDVWATLSTLDIVRSELVPALLVLNRVPARAALTAAMRKELAQYDVGLAATSISNRVAFAAAFTDGWGTVECAPGSSAETEMAALAAELLGLLPFSRHEREWAAEPVHPRVDILKCSLEEVAGHGVANLGGEAPRSDPLEPHLESTALTDGSDGNLVDLNSSLTREKLLSGIAFLKKRLTPSRI